MTITTAAFRYGLLCHILKTVANSLTGSAFLLTAACLKKVLKLKL